MTDHFDNDTQASSVEKELAETTKKAPKTGSPRKKESGNAIVVLLAIIVCMALGALFLIKNGLHVASPSLWDSYQTAKEKASEEAESSTRQKIFDRVSQLVSQADSNVSISIGNVEEMQTLEVLKAGDTELIIEERSNNSDNITAWLKVEGEGTFVVDLHAAEFIIDNERKYVLVRIPKPELTNIVIKNTTRSLFADDFNNGNYDDGVELAIEQRIEAMLRIQSSLLSNQYIYSNAKKVTVSMLQNIVKAFNPKVADLIVDVEFIE